MSFEFQALHDDLVRYIDYRMYKKSYFNMKSDDQQLYTLTYMSHSLIKTEDLASELRNIENIAGNNNTARRISGILIHCHNRFVQRLEGDRDAIYSLLERIKNDKRHTKLEVLFEGPIKQRFYNDWSEMKVITEEQGVETIERVLVNLDLRDVQQLSEQESGFIVNFLQHFEPRQ